MTFTPNHFACWFEIPVTDLEASRDFYAKVFDMELKIEDGGPSDLVMFPVGDEAGGVSGSKPPVERSNPRISKSPPDTLVMRAIWMGIRSVCSNLNPNPETAAISPCFAEGGA